MSSILKALKKLENEESQQQQSQAFDVSVYEIDIKNTIKRKQRRVVNQRAAVISVVGICIVFVVGWLGMSHFFKPVSTEHMAQKKVTSPIGPDSSASKLLAKNKNTKVVSEIVEPEKKLKPAFEQDIPKVPNVTKVPASEKKLVAVSPQKKTSPVVEKKDVEKKDIDKVPNVIPKASVQEKLPEAQKDLVVARAPQNEQIPAVPKQADTKKVPSGNLKPQTTVKPVSSDPKTIGRASRPVGEPIPLEQPSVDTIIDRIPAAASKKMLAQVAPKKSLKDIILEKDIPVKKNAIPDVDLDKKPGQAKTPGQTKTSDLSAKPHVVPEKMAQIPQLDTVPKKLPDLNAVPERIKVPTLSKSDIDPITAPVNAKDKKPQGGVADNDPLNKVPSLPDNTSKSKILASIQESDTSGKLPKPILPKSETKKESQPKHIASKPISKSPPPPAKVAEWLKLQAISWSDIPSRRIAVINNVVVREGGNVEDGVVTRIEKEYVVVKSKGEEWALKFRMK